MGRLKQLSSVTATIAILCAALLSAPGPNDAESGVSTAPDTFAYATASALPAEKPAGVPQFALETSDEDPDTHPRELVIGVSTTDRPSRDGLSHGLAAPRSPERIYLLSHALLI